LRDTLATAALSASLDKTKWKLTKTGKFLVKSLYDKLSSVGVDRSFKQLWKSKTLLKIKIRLWLIWHNAVATKDNMKRKKWLRNYSFCSEDETINHMFFNCSSSIYMWSTISVSIIDIDLLILLNFLVDLLKFFHLVLIFILLGLQLYAGYGKLAIELVLMASLYHRQ
jgi:hypothetical protein